MILEQKDKAEMTQGTNNYSGLIMRENEAYIIPSVGRNIRVFQLEKKNVAETKHF